MSQEEGEEQAPILSTEEEVQQLNITSNRGYFQLLITRPETDLLKQSTFVDRDAHLGTEGLTEFRSFKDPNYDLIRQLNDAQIQSSSTTTEASSQTSWSRMVNSSAQTEYATMLPEHQQSIQQTDDFIDFLRKVSENVIPILDTNLISDVFQDQLASLVAADDSLVKSFSISQFKEILSLKDARFTLPIACIDWMPGRNDTIGISFCGSTNFSQFLKTWPDAPVQHLFIWRFDAILHPTYVLEAPSPILAFKFCPTNSNIIAGGCENGQVVMWDLSDELTQISAELRNSFSTEDSFSKFYRPKYSSLILSPNLTPTKCSTQPVTDLQWLPPKVKISRIGDIDQSEETTQFMTISLDGKMIVWDTIVDQTIHANTDGFLPGSSLINEWIPTFSMNILKAPKTPISLPTRLLSIVYSNGKLTGDVRIATEEGSIVGFNWTSDRSLIGRQNPLVTINQQLLNHTSLGFISSPFIDGLYIACDRYNISMTYLKQGIEELFRSSIRSTPLTCVQFSPTRPSVFIAGKENGEIEVWSMLDKSYECMFTQNLASSPITNMAFWENEKGKQIIAVGCSDGSLMIFKVPDFMSKPLPNEKEQMQAFVDQQRKFVSQTGKRQKDREDEARRKDTEARITKVESTNKKEEEENDESKVDVDLQNFEKEYARIVKDFEALEEKAAD